MVFIVRHDLNVEPGILEHFKGHVHVRSADHVGQVKGAPLFCKRQCAEQSCQVLAAFRAVDGGFASTHGALDAEFFSWLSALHRGPKRGQNALHSIHVPSQQAFLTVGRQWTIVQRGQGAKQPHPQTRLSRVNGGGSWRQGKVAVDGHGRLAKFHLSPELRRHHQGMRAIVRLGRSPNHRRSIGDSGDGHSALHDAFAGRGPNGVPRQCAGQNP